MTMFFHHAIHPKKHPSQKDSHGFYDGFVYKIINKEDKSVMQVEWEEKDGKQVCRIITDEDVDSNSQRFRASRIEKGKNEGKSQLQSVGQMDTEIEYIWDYQPHLKQLIQNPSNHVWNRLWLTKKKKPGVYYIKATTDDLCLTNMGKGKQVALLPMSPDKHWRQNWILEPVLMENQE